MDDRFVLSRSDTGTSLSVVRATIILFNRSRPKREDCTSLVKNSSVSLFTRAYPLVRGSGINNFTANKCQQRLNFCDVLNRNRHVVAVQHRKISELIRLKRALSASSNDIQAPLIVYIRSASILDGSSSRARVAAPLRVFPFNNHRSDTKGL